MINKDLTNKMEHLAARICMECTMADSVMVGWYGGTLLNTSSLIILTACFALQRTALLAGVPIV